MQARLSLAGFEGVPNGLWGPLTEGAARALALEAEVRGQSFHSSTREGAAALVAYIDLTELTVDLLVDR